ncbi:MAG TPA: YncE family protein [Candidatus Acidoferrum sp.]|nr:YncE family protein [Candidatus Acidoferrum sp.]
MKKQYLLLMTALVLFAVPAQCQQTAPLKQVQTFTFPATVKGHFDHFEVDLKGNRLFTTPEDYKAVVVFDLKTGKLVHTITGIERPHAVLYREDLNRIYVTDGQAGDVKIFDGKTYGLIKSVKLLADADSIGYDSATKFLYIDNGGGDVHQTYSMLSVVDTTAGTKLADIKVDGETIEAMTLEKSSARIYVNIRTKNSIAVVDRAKREVVATWPVTKCKVNVAMALDEANHRLFAACRDGQVAVLDTESGKEVAALAITTGVDDVVFDPASKRFYASADGAVDVYGQTDANNYKHLGKVTTGPVGRTARLVPELGKYFVAVPQHGTTNAEVLVFDVQR